MKNKLAVPQNVEYRVNVLPSNFISRYMPEKIKSLHLCKILYMSDHSGIIHNSQNFKTI